ncbi:hypothetical protein FHQ08_12830 [Lactobacillus sp. CC-MHH1034]|nr:hypothetical protein [Agrilactobacillus fermenti]
MVFPIGIDVDLTQITSRCMSIEIINQKKTHVGSPLRLKFLGFTLGVSKGKAYARPHKVAKERIKQALKLITKRNRGVSLDTVLKEIKRKMRGWLRYYSIGRMKGFLKAHSNLTIFVLNDQF